MSPLDKSKLTAAMKLYSETQIEVFRHAIDYADIPLQTYALFLFIPLKGSISMSQVVKLFNTLSQAAVSRNVSLLCGDSRLRMGGRV